MEGDALLDAALKRLGRPNGRNLRHYPGDVSHVIGQLALLGRIEMTSGPPGVISRPGYSPRAGFIKHHSFNLPILEQLGSIAPEV
jgi:hypothetical protein